MTLSRLQRTGRRLVAVEMVLWLILVAVTAGLAIGLIDATVPLPGIVRLAAGLAMAAAVVAVATWGIRRLRRTSALSLARQLQRRDRSLGSQLSNACQLAAVDAPAGVAVALRDAAVRRGERLAAEVNVAVIRRAARRRLSVAAAVVGVAVAVLVGSWPGPAGRIAMRLLDPLGDHPPATRHPIHLTPPPVAVAAGAVVHIEARTDRPAAQLDVVLLDDAGTPLARRPMASRPDGTFNFSLVNLREPVRFHVSDGWSRTRRHRIGLLPPPPAPVEEDHPPRLTLRSPPRILARPDQAPVIEVAIADDHGLAVLIEHQTLSPTEGPTRTLLAGERRHTLRRALDLAALGAVPERTLTWRVAATDTAGQTAVSEPVTIQIVAPAEHAAALARQREMEAALAAAAEFAATSDVLAATDADLPAVRARLAALAGEVAAAADDPALARAASDLQAAADADPADAARLAEAAQTLSDRLRAGRGQGRGASDEPVVFDETDVADGAPATAPPVADPAAGLLTASGRRTAEQVGGAPVDPPAQAGRIYVPPQHRAAAEAYLRALAEAAALGEAPPAADNAPAPRPSDAKE